MPRVTASLLACLLASAAALHAPGPALRLPSQPATRDAVAVATATALPSPQTSAEAIRPALFSGLNGKAMDVTKEDVPTKAQVRAVVPAHCFKKSTLRSMGCVVQSLICTAATAALYPLIPWGSAAALPLWLGWSAITGTAAMGLWVLAHECGHGAFSDNRFLQDVVGFVLHSALLVPYFSWQRSHAVHHSRTNHITEGETHVPTVVDARPGIESPGVLGGEGDLDLARKMGRKQHGLLQLAAHLFIGWPSYLIFGATGGPKYGLTNHFVPRAPFSTKLWPNRWPAKVWQSTMGVAAALALLGAWCRSAGAGAVLSMYGGPLLVVNAWLIVYTWLQHTDVDVPHLSAEEFTYMRGAFLTIDRPYGKLCDFLHHRIGSTHVAHHIDCTIPHYHALEATEAIKAAFPKAYLFDPTPVHKALWRVACDCIAVKRTDDGRYVFVQPQH